VNKNKLEQMAALEDSKLCFTARVGELSEMFKLEQTKHHQAIKDQMDLFQQVQESPNAEKIARCAMEESSHALMAQHRAAQEMSGTFLMELSTKLMAIDATLKDLQSSFQQQMNENQESMQNHFEKLTSAQEQALLANTNNMLLSLQLDLDNETRRREHTFNSLKDEIAMNYNKNLDAFTCETSSRKADIYCQQLSLKDLCEKFDAFQAEINDVTHRLWNSIDMHTHDVCVDEFLNKANLVRVDKECQTSVVRSISPYAVRVAAGTGASAIPVNRLVTSQKQFFLTQPNIETHSPSEFLRPALHSPVNLSDSRYLNTRSTLERSLPAYRFDNA